jgi:hypothetical protein
MIKKPKTEVQTNNGLPPSGSLAESVILALEMESSIVEEIINGVDMAA